jgi:hypothetical protein
MAAEASAGRYVFAYGSLINPASLRRTLPQLDLRCCLPARCAGMVRTFGVAFPNDGSQTDKWYADDQGHRPPRVLFTDLKPHPAVTTNGILMPVTPGDLTVLGARELRYELIDVTLRVGLWDGAVPELPVVTFVGRTEYTRTVDVAAGVVSAAYLETIRAGARFWDGQVAGFDAAYAQSTACLPPERIRPLTRYEGARELRV